MRKPLSWRLHNTGALYYVALTEWYVQAGVTGLFSVCLSSEMFQVSCVCMHAFVCAFECGSL